MVKVKICGITNFEDAKRSSEYGADLLGFIFVKGTPRHIEPDEAVGIIDRVKKRYPKVGMVALFKDERLETVKQFLSGQRFDHVQLHGTESPEYCMSVAGSAPVGVMKVFKVDRAIVPNGGNYPEDYKNADYFVFDTYHPERDGGTGLRFDWDALNDLSEDVRGRTFVAGGLDPDNVADAVRAVAPYGVDTSSGVEKQPGKKDATLLKEFIENAKNT
ncbi:MAG: N-(5'-phosphoribosyl)anthranilate isomerase [Candidatus Omnitrophica bacterium]|nr:N-(5'-phosphoribosyl)anthranilate isomerase [Candidatus Omnitrophota bacterium]